MTKISIDSKAAIYVVFGLVVLLPTVAPRVARGAETTSFSAHICSGCPACDQPAVSAPQAIEHGCIDHLHRAGHPETQSKYAQPSLNRRYSFGYVGGAAAFHGEPRFADEGTWGVDYSGILFKKQTWLGWLHGHREPRHDGSYHTDGPHLLEH